MSNRKMTSLFETPLILEWNYSPEEVAYEVERYWSRKEAVKDFLAGRIDVEVFEDILNENGIDVVQAYEDWSNGICYADG